MNNNRMNKNDIKIHILNASNKLDSVYDKINTISKSTIKKVIDVMPTKQVDIVIHVNLGGVIPEIGIGGRTMDQNEISISLDPSRNNLNEIIENELPRTIAHELHHAKRWQTIGYGDTLLGAMISEGLADHFDIEVNKNESLYPWTQALNEEQIVKFLEKAKIEFYNKNYNHSDWFFGTNKDIPKWTGYTLGYRIIENYLKSNPDKKSSNLFDTTSDKFII